MKIKHIILMLSIALISLSASTQSTIYFINLNQTLGIAPYNSKQSYLGTSAKGHLFTVRTTLTANVKLEKHYFNFGIGIHRIQGDVDFATSRSNRTLDFILFIPIIGRNSTPVYHATSLLNVQHKYVHIPLSFRFIKTMFNEENVGLYLEPMLNFGIPFMSKYRGELTSNPDYVDQAKSAFNILSESSNEHYISLRLGSGMLVNLNRFTLDIGGSIPIANNKLEFVYSNVKQSIQMTIGIGYRL